MVVTITLEDSDKDLLFEEKAVISEEDFNIYCI